MCAYVHGLPIHDSHGHVRDLADHPHGSANVYHQNDHVSGNGNAHGDGHGSVHARACAVQCRVNGHENVCDREDVRVDVYDRASLAWQSPSMGKIRFSK
jgi:hypothetical protein